MKRFIIFCFLFSCFFPYLRLLPLDMDHQPNALLVGIVLLCISPPKKIQWDFVLLFWGVLCAFVCLLFTSMNATGIRCFMVYLNLFLLPYISYISLSYIGGLPYSVYKAVVWIWGIVGFIQRFLYSRFFFFLLTRSPEEGGGRGRGVVGLAVEPTYYGMFCLILIMILYLNFWKRERCWFYLFFLIIQLLLFTMSTTCILIMLGVGACFTIYKVLLSKYRFRILFASLIVGLSIYYLFFVHIANMEGLRLATATRQLLEDPSNFLIMDYSVNNRFMHAFYPIKGFFDNWGMPHGFAGYGDYLHKMSLDSVHWKFLQIDIENEDRVPTMLGAPLFELGVFSFPMFYVIIKSFVTFKNDSKAVLCMFLFFILSLNLINYTNSLIGLFIGNLIYLSHTEIRRQKNSY